MTRAPAHRAAACAAVVVGVALGWPCAAGAQSFPIVPPKLPPRGVAPQGVPGAVPSQAQNPAAYGGAPATAVPSATHPQPYGQPPSYPPQQPAPYGQQSYPQQPYAASPPAAVAIAAPRAGAGPCRVLPSPERQALALVTGEPPLPREQVPLGEFRAQQVVHSADGRWAVVFTKLRGAPQFAALTFDLERCSVQRTIELPGAGSDAAFDGDQAVLRFAGGERRIGLKDGSVR